MNEASLQICLANPAILSDRQELLVACRKRVHDDGYSYKRGKSRSKRLGDTTESTPKRKKVSEEYRLRRIDAVQESIQGLTDRIGYKEKRRDAANNMRNYKECDQLTEEISTLKVERRQCETELTELKRKQEKSKYSKAYWRKKSQPSDYSPSSPLATPFSPSSSSGSCLTTPSPAPAFPPRSPSSRLSSHSPLTTPSPAPTFPSLPLTVGQISSKSPLQSPLSSDSETVSALSVRSPDNHSGDTILLSDEEALNPSTSSKSYSQHFQ